MRYALVAITLALTSSFAQAEEETFVVIQKVRGNQIAVVKDNSGGRGGRGGGGAMAGRGRRGGTATAQPVVVSVPENTKITTALRERRTFEFRVGGEIAGGLKHRLFNEMKKPLPARIVTEGSRIVEINVVTPEIDINQTHTDSSGQTVIAIRPKRPPMKK